MTRVAAVLFDLDDTLFDHRHCSQSALAAVQASHESLACVPFDVLEQAHGRLLEELHREVMVGKVPIDEARRERFRRLYGTAGVDADEALSSAAAAAYREAYIVARRAIAGASALLPLIKARARVGIVSNNLLDEQLQKLRDCGLDAFIDALVVSEEVGISKPDPRIFRVALDRLHCDADQAVMIGDSWAADIVGAAAAGIRAIWFNRNGMPRPDPDVAVTEIRALEPPDDVLRMIFGPDRD